MANNLAALRKKRGWSQDELASRMDTTRNQLAKLEGKSRRLSDIWIERAAIALGVDPGQIVTAAAGTPVLGHVGAGAQVAYFGEEQGQLDTVERPPGGTDKTAALRVNGDSMPGVAEDQWLIYYDERVSGFPDAWIGDLCVVWLADERVFIKKIYRGRVPGTFDLHSTSGLPPIDGEDISFAAKVTWIKPR